MSSLSVVNLLHRNRFCLAQTFPLGSNRQTDSVWDVGSKGMPTSVQTKVGDEKKTFFLMCLPSRH